ncbi:unnamed protein product, partial [Urochloa humidicola]
SPGLNQHPNKATEELLRQAANPAILSGELRHGALARLREDLLCRPPTRLQPASMRGEASMVMVVEGACAYYPC